MWVTHFCQYMWPYIYVLLFWSSLNQVWDHSSWNSWETTTLWPTSSQLQWLRSAWERPLYSTTTHCFASPGSKHTVMQCCSFRTTTSCSKLRNPPGQRRELVDTAVKMCRLVKWTDILARLCATHFSLYGVLSKSECMLAATYIFGYICHNMYMYIYILIICYILSIHTSVES